MATLRVTVQIGGDSPLADTEANRNTILTIGGAPQGNLNTRNETVSDKAYQLNNPSISGSVSVSSYSPVTFDSSDLLDNMMMAGQLLDFIAKGYIVVVNMAAPETPLATAGIMAFVNP